MDAGAGAAAGGHLRHRGQLMAVTAVTLERRRPPGRATACTRNWELPRKRPTRRTHFARPVDRRKKPMPRRIATAAEFSPAGHLARNLGRLGRGGQTRATVATTAADGVSSAIVPAAWPADVASGTARSSRFVWTDCRRLAMSCRRCRSDARTELFARSSGPPESRRHSP